MLGIQALSQEGTKNTAYDQQLRTYSQLVTLRAQIRATRVRIYCQELVYSREVTRWLRFDLITIVTSFLTRSAAGIATWTIIADAKTIVGQIWIVCCTAVSILTGLHLVSRAPEKIRKLGQDAKDFLLLRGRVDNLWDEVERSFGN